MRLADYRTRPIPIPEDLLDAQLTAARPHSVFRERVRSVRPLLAMAGLLIGLLLAVQWRGLQEGQGQPAARSATRAQLTTSISDLEVEQKQLKQSIGDTRNQINALLDQAAEGKVALNRLNDSLQVQHHAAGLTALHGEGVVATFDDSQSSSTPPDANLADYIIHEYDLRDGINALLEGGAEAVSLNGERIIGTTSVYCVGSTIIVNSTRLSPPYNISAIGNANALSESLIKSPQMAKFNQRARQAGVTLNVVSSSDVSVPEYKGEVKLKYGKPLREGR